MAFGQVGRGFGKLGANNKRTSGSSPSLPLDGIATGLKVAYSTRRLLTSYAANKAIRVQRLSDNAQSDIGFVSNVLDTATLASFCSGTTGVAITWYDQSGGGFDMTTPGLSNTPVIYQSGAVNVINGKAALKGSNASAQFLQNASLSPNPTNTLYQNVVGSFTLAFTSAICGTAAAGGLEWRVNADGTMSFIRSSVVGIASSSAAVTANVGAVLESQYNNVTGAFSFWANRASKGTGTATSAMSAATARIGASSGGDQFDGLFGEYIAYDLVGGIPGATQTAIQNNQQTYWGTP